MTDQQLKALFPKLLPGRVYIISNAQSSRLYWLSNTPNTTLEVEVQDNQLLSLCREVTMSLTDEEYEHYKAELSRLTYHKSIITHARQFNNASWQERTEGFIPVLKARIQAAAEVSGIL